jgi:virginiamycin B lyase
MQLGSRPLFPFLFLSLIAACGSDGSGGSGGSGGSSTQTGGSGSGARGGSSAGGSGGSSSTGTGGSSSTGTGGSSSTGTGGSSAGTGGSGAGTGGGGAGGSGGSGGSSAGGSGGSQSGTGGSGMAPDGGPAAEAGGMPGKLGAPVEFTIPRANNYPHDPAVDSMGRGWWVDSDNSYVGYWDPATMMTKDFASKTPGCYLHGLNPDDKDNIWYTGKGCNKIGKVEPATGTVTEYPVMGDPHTLVFHKGAIWFTVQNGNSYGRLDPATGMSQVWSAGAGSGPYGIWPAPDGTLWMALFGGGANGRRIAQINPENPAMLRTLPVPNGGNPRRIAVDKKGHVYYTDYPRGYLGRFDPAANKFEEFLSPKGPGSGPYGITIGPDDRIYYFQGMNSIAVFNPAAPTAWEVVRIQTGGVTVRNMTTDFQRRRVWLGLNGPNPGKIAYIQVP